MNELPIAQRNFPGHTTRDPGGVPLFSVCTEVTNREKTIRKTIESIAQQTYRNFEYIIVNNHSDDRSDEIIRNALLELPFNDVAVTYHTADKKLSDIESWNAPLLHARGTYIVVCEGDDWFAPDHLAKAAQVLMEHTNIGLYVAGRGDLNENTNHEKYHGIENRTPRNILLDKLVRFVFAPPPSEAIFLRMGNNGPFLYNQEQYVYAAEYGLYYDILRQGFDGYIHPLARTVFRGHSLYMRRLFHVRDGYRALEMWRHEYHDRNEYVQARMKLLRRSIRICAAQIIRLSIERALVLHILHEGIVLRTVMPLWALPKDVMVCIRQQLGIIKVRFRSYWRAHFTL